MAAKTGNATMASASSTSHMRGESRQSERSGRCSVSIWFLLLSNLLVFQLTYLHKSMFKEGTLTELLLPEMIPRHQQQLAQDELSRSSYILDFERGPAVALPSVRVEKDEKEADRKHYGGAGDKAHLGGFTEIDLFGITPAVWKHMITYFGIKSLLDVGCGRGISTSWFTLHGVDTMCVEGSHDAVSQSILPDPSSQVVEHDFSRGPWWPPRE